MSTFTKVKNDKEIWAAETFRGQDGATICDLRLKKKNGLGHFVPVQSDGVKIALIANVDQLPTLIGLLGQIYYTVKGGAQ